MTQLIEEILLKSPALAAFCREHHIVRLALFGSILRDDFSGESDVDFLVEFDSEHIPGLLRLCAIEDQLSVLIGRKADLRTPLDLSRYFRDKVVRQAQVLYAA